MWWQQTVMAIIGLSAGFAVASGIFALIIALGVVARFAGKTHTARYIFLYEDAVAMGGILGNLISVYAFPIRVGLFGAGVFGAFSGVFVGAWAMALTEILDIFPIFTRRISLRRGMELIIVSMAVGRTLGGLLYFWKHW